MILLNQIDGYNREPSACRFCNRSQRDHGYLCVGPNRRWTPPQDWLILSRMQIRQGDRFRWLPDDYRTGYRKWDTGTDPE